LRDSGIIRPLSARQACMEAAETVVIPAVWRARSADVLRDFGRGAAQRRHTIGRIDQPSMTGRR
jgi:hypothetical protein